MSELHPVRRKTISLSRSELLQIAIGTVDASNVGAEPVELSASLSEMLVDLFDNSDELVHFLHQLPDGDRLMAVLPPTGDLSRLAFEAVLALQRRGMLDDGFFENLLNQRPDNHEDITTAAERWRAGDKY